MSTTRKVATSYADLQKDIENRISKFVADSEQKGCATFDPKLPNGWRLDLYTQKIVDTTYVGVMIIPDPGKDGKLYHTVRAGDKKGIRKAAEGAAKVVTEYETDSEKAALLLHVKTI